MTSVPLLERLKFLCISSSNLDEFFEIRVAGLKQIHELGSTQLAPDALTIPEQLTAIHARALALVADQYRCLNDVILPALHVRRHRGARPLASGRRKLRRGSKSTSSTKSSRY